MSADVPAEVGSEKYDAAFKAILAIQKYYLAVPFNRQAYYQSLLNMPLPVSTQWKLIEEVANCALSISPTLERLAANATLIHHDDNHQSPDKKRTGMFTTGVIANTGKHEIALFYNGTKHSGENMEKLLAKRKPGTANVIQMCDAYNCNLTKSFKTILCHCLSHGFRKFDELKAFYPDECIYVIERLAKVYRFDENAQDLNPDERLQYHHKHSKPVMDDIVERALKIPIRGRRTWLFYKTEYGAMVGGVLTSVIHTCALAGENPLHYLTALQENKNQIVNEPEHWLPWNYQQQLNIINKAA